MKTNEVVYMINDLAKNLSDDATFTEDHILWLCKKYRSFILKKELELLKKINNTANQQTLCIDVCPTHTSSIDECDLTVLLSNQEIPDMIGDVKPLISISNVYYSLISYVTREKFKYVNNNRFTNSIIYCTIGSDNKLYLKSSNPSFLNLEQIQVTGVFDDFEEAAELSCDGNGSTCDPLEQEFPLENDLIPVLIQSVLKDLLGGLYRPADRANNAMDDLSLIAQFIRQNMKSPLTKLIDGDD